MKGQSAIFEQVLLFGISVAIFVMAFAVFQVYQSHFSSVASVDHARAVRDIVYGAVMEMSRIERINSSVKLQIPERINGEGYKITLNNTAVTIRTYDTGLTVSSGIASLSRANGGAWDFSGTATSSRREIIIYKRGSNIILG